MASSGEVEARLKIVGKLLRSVASSEGAMARTMNKVKLLNELAKELKMIKDPNIIRSINATVTLTSLRHLLVSPNIAVRSGTLRALRYFMVSEPLLVIVYRHNLDMVIARSFEREGNQTHETERLQAIKLMRVMLLLQPESFPMTFCRALSASGESQNDTFSRVSLAILCELATLNPPMINMCGAVRTIMSAIVSTQISSINEFLTLSLVQLLNTPSTRTALRPYDLEMITAPLLDGDYKHAIDSAEGTDGQAINEKLEHLDASHMGVIWMMRTWPGLTFLCRNQENNTISRLIQSLGCPSENNQFAIMDVFFHVLHIRIPVDSPKFEVALESMDHSLPQASWSLEKGWMAEECRSVLPRGRAHRLDFIHQYHAIVLRILLEHGLLERLSEVSLSASATVRTHAQVLLGEILHMCSTILSPEYADDCMCLPTLVSLATNPNEEPERRHRALNVMTQLDHHRQFRKKPIVPKNPYITKLLQQQQCGEWLYYPEDMDDNAIIVLLRDIVGTGQEYTDWNWPSLAVAIRIPCLTVKKIEELAPKMLRRVMHFYLPSSTQYSSLSQKAPSASVYSQVGAQLVVRLAAASGSDDGPKVLLDWLQEVILALQELCTHSYSSAILFSEDRLANKLARDYFLFLGHLSATRSGIALLEKHNVFKILLDVCDIAARPDAQRLLIASLDYKQDSYSRIILSKLLTGSPKEVRLYATEHMRVFFRARQPFFRTWGMEALTLQLYDVEPNIAEAALSVLDEACQDEACLKMLVSLQPALLHLGQKGRSLFLRFLSCSSGFILLKAMNFISQEMESWLTSECLAYVVSAETQLTQTLLSFKHLPEGHYARRSLDCEEEQYAPHNVQLLLPVHLYGELCQHREGFNMLSQAGHVSHFVHRLQESVNSTSTGAGVQRIKAAVWALCHIGSSTGGVEALVKDGVFSIIIDLAKTSPVYSLRGTCVLALALVAQRPEGCAALVALGWQCSGQAAGVAYFAAEEHEEESDSTAEFDGAFDTSLKDDEDDCSTTGRIESLGSTEDRSLPKSHTDKPISESDTIPGKFRRRTLSGNDSTMVKIQRQSTPDEVAVPPQRYMPRKSSVPFATAPPQISWGNTLGRSTPTGSLTSANSPSGRFSPRALTPLRRRISMSPSQSSVFTSVDKPSREGTLGLLAFKNKARAASNLFAVCLPDDIRQLFEFDAPQCTSSFAEHGIDMSFDLYLKFDNLHVPETCLKCCITPNDDIINADQENTVVTAEGAYGSKVATDATQFSDKTPAQRNAFAKEVVKLVTKLSCPVGSRATQQSLLAMKDRSPAMFKDICMYSQVAQVLATYHFRLHVRVFIQGMFDVADTLSPLSPLRSGATSPSKHSETVKRTKVNVTS